MRWAGHVAHVREMDNVHRILIGKPEEKRPLGRSRGRWEDNSINKDIKEMSTDLIYLAQDKD
jgi:hypothetical protein